MKHGRYSTNDGTAERDTWCTPAWLAAALGRFDLDPCSNKRSHIRSQSRFGLDWNACGLELAGDVAAEQTVFINPPYSVGQVIRWVRAYRHARFCFLLRFDPSTDWFAELYKSTRLVAIPRRRRINFEPPPGVKASSNVYPHALFYAREEDATAAILRACIAWRVR